MGLAWGTAGGAFTGAASSRGVMAAPIGPTCDRMVFNTVTGEGQMQGGGGQSPGGKGAKSRPRAVIYPSKTATPSAAHP